MSKLLLRPELTESSPKILKCVLTLRSKLYHQNYITLSGHYIYCYRKKSNPHLLHVVYLKILGV